MTTQTAVPTQPTDTAAVSTASRPDSDIPPTLSLDISSILAMLPDDDALDDWFLKFTADNEHLGYRFEIDRKGWLIAMASEGYDGMQWQFNLQHDLQNWIDTGPGGLVVIGNALIRTSGFGRRAADAGWITPEQHSLLTPEQRRHGIPFAPFFVVEIRSISNSLEDQQAKMEEWISYGTTLGWLIDPFLRQVHIYRPGAAPEIRDNPETVRGEPELPEFVFEVRRRIFDLD